MTKYVPMKNVEFPMATNFSRICSSDVNPIMTQFDEIFGPKLRRGGGAKRIGIRNREIMADSDSGRSPEHGMNTFSCQTYQKLYQNGENVNF